MLAHEEMPVVGVFFIVVDDVFGDGVPVAGIRIQVM